MKRAWIKSIMDDVGRAGGKSLDLLSRAERAFAYDIVSILPSNGNGMSLLDIGHGSMARFAPLTFLNYRVFGIHPLYRDNTDPGEFGRFDSHVEVIRCGFPEEPIPAKNETFDWIVLSNLPEPHDQAARMICAEARRLIKREGRMILKSHNPLAGPRGVAGIDDSGAPLSERLIHACCPKLAETVERSGFKVILRMYRNYRAFHKPIFVRHVCSLARLITPRLCDTVILVCAKR